MKTKMVKLMLVVGAIGVLVLVAGCSGSVWIGLVPVPNESPVASFTATPSTGVAPLLVHFDASESFDPEGGPLSYEWDFGGGVKKSGVVVTETFWDDSDFNNDGTQDGYPVILKVTDLQGAANSCLLVVYVSNPRPVARFTASLQSVLTGAVVHFNPSQSYDPANVEVEAEVETNPEGIVPGPTPGQLTGTIVSWQWNFGDNTTGSGPSPTHVYEDDSDQNNDGVNEGFIVTLVVTDNDGAQSIPFPRRVYVWNRPPVADFCWSTCQVPPSSAKKVEIKNLSMGIIPTPVYVWVKVDGWFSYDLDGDIVKYQWFYGGEPLLEGPVIYLKLVAGKEYPITLVVTDDDEAVDSIIQLVVGRI